MHGEQSISFISARLLGRMWLRFAGQWPVAAQTLNKFTYWGSTGLDPAGRPSRTGLLEEFGLKNTES